MKPHCGAEAPHSVSAAISQLTFSIVEYLIGNLDANVDLGHVGLHNVLIKAGQSISFLLSTFFPVERGSQHHR